MNSRVFFYFTFEFCSRLWRTGTTQTQTTSKSGKERKIARRDKRESWGCHFFFHSLSVSLSLSVCFAVLFSLAHIVKYAYKRIRVFFSFSFSRYVQNSSLFRLWNFHFSAAFFISLHFSSFAEVFFFLWNSDAFPPLKRDRERRRGSEGLTREKKKVLQPSEISSFLFKSFFRCLLFLFWRFFFLFRFSFFFPEALQMTFLFSRKMLESD